jgi:hypothetical protein
MNLDTRLKELADAAIDISQIAKPEVRHKGGFWLNGQLVELYEDHIFTYDQRIEFMTIVKIMLEVIFRDAVEDTSDLHEIDVPTSANMEMFQIAREQILNDEG